MNEQQHIDYNRIAAAIEYLQQNFTMQPTLKEIAQKVNLSPYHFQRLFTDWAGVSPKKFLQYISVQHAKEVLHSSQSTLFETAYRTGLSGTGRLHDLFVNIEGMTPGEYKNKGENLTINYSFAKSPFGKILVASTQKGICHMAFSDSEENAFYALRKLFPKANFFEKFDDIQENALRIYTQDWGKIRTIKLHLKGTAFQLKVWEALLKIPSGNLTNYGAIARHIDKPTASRAVGTAIGHNPIAYLIPCHRVITATGAFGGYRWGPVRKTAIVGWEASRISTASTAI